MKVYFDNAATTPLATPVKERMVDLIGNIHGNPSSIHAEGRKARAVIEEARKSVANHIKASQGEIFFTSCATESNNTAILGAARDLGVKHIITSPTEHPCVLNSAKYTASHFGIELQLLHVDKKGNPDLDQLEETLSNNGKTLVSLMHGNNEIGTIIDIKTVGELCQSFGALFHCDTVQTVAKYDIDLTKQYISFLSGSGHKIYGPKGIGFMYINNDNMIKALIKGGGQERELRSGTENVYGIGGLAAAMDFTVAHREEHIKYIQGLRERFKAGLASAGIDVRYNGNQDDNYLHHVLSMNIPKNDRTDMIMMNLDIYGICASAGSACSSGVESDSHVLDAIGAPKDRKTMRFSFSYNNTAEEVDYAISKFEHIL